MGGNYGIDSFSMGNSILSDSMMALVNLINWSELSRYITGGDRNNIRPNRVSKKHISALDRLFHEELPQWWEEYKRKNRL